MRVSFNLKFPKWSWGRAPEKVPWLIFLLGGIKFGDVRSKRYESNNKPDDDNEGPGDGQTQTTDNKQTKEPKTKQSTTKNECHCSNDTASIINQLAILADSINNINKASSTAAPTETPSQVQVNLDVELDGAESFRYLRSLISTSSTSPKKASPRVPTLRRKRAYSRLSLLNKAPFVPNFPTPAKTARSPRYTPFPPTYKQQVPTPTARPKVRFGLGVDF